MTEPSFADLPLEGRIGHRIRRKREIMGKSQREVAEAIRMGPAQYSRLEKGDYFSIRFDQLIRLADALHTTTDYLLWRSDDMGIIPPDVCPGAPFCLRHDTALPAAHAC